MKQNYKIRVDEKELPPERIDSHKDFNKVLADYHNLTQPLYKKPLYKNPKAFGGLMLILSMAAVVYIAVQEEKAGTAAVAAADSAAQEVVALAPTFAQTALPKGEAVDFGKAAQLPGLRGTFQLPDLGKQSLTFTRYGTADELIATGTPSLDHDDHGIQVEQIFSLEAELEEAEPFTWTQVREKGEDIVLHRWDAQAMHWVAVEAPRRELIKVDAKQQEQPGDDGFKAIEFGNGTAEDKEVKSSTAHDAVKEKEQFTFTLALPGMFRLARRMPETSQLTYAALKPVQADGSVLKLQRMFFVYENGNLQNTTPDGEAWKSNLNSGGAIAAYGITAQGKLAYVPASALRTDGSPVTFTLWEGTPESPDALLRKLFALQN